MKYIIPFLFLFTFSFGEQLDGGDSVAVIRLRRINSESIKHDWEYGGGVYKCPDHYGTTIPRTNKKKSAVSIRARIPFECKRIGIYHTHGATSIGYVDESFSDQDTAHSSIRQYLITPNGKIQRFMPDTRKVQLLVDTGWVYITKIKEDHWFIKVLNHNYLLNKED